MKEEERRNPRQKDLLMKAIYQLDPYFFEKTYGPTERADLAKLVSIEEKLYTKSSILQDPTDFRDVELIFSGWYPVLMDEAFLARFPRLKAVFHAGGSIRPITTEAFWEQGIRITSAAAQNALPVSEYALSQILFCLKRGWYFARMVKEGIPLTLQEPLPGLYRTVVGIVSLGQIGRRVCNLLKAFDVEILAYDPYATPQVASDFNVRLCSLEEVFRKSDVVSIHAPVLDETIGMIRGKHIASMKQYGSLINSAKREIVCEKELIEILPNRPDLQIVIDGHLDNHQQLTQFPNLVLTEYLAGARDGECRRLGRFMVEELQRYLEGKVLEGEVSKERAEQLA